MLGQRRHDIAARRSAIRLARDGRGGAAGRGRVRTDRSHGRQSAADLSVSGEGRKVGPALAGPFRYLILRSAANGAKTAAWNA